MQKILIAILFAAPAVEKSKWLTSRIGIKGNSHTTVQTRATPKSPRSSRNG